jgi:hypothetical protein
MITDSKGKKVSPRQKAAEIILGRIGDWLAVDPLLEKDMTDREVSLVNKQIEKMHKRIVSNLEKAKKE